MNAATSTYLFNERPLWSFVFWASFFAFFVVGSWVQNRERNLAPGDNRDRGSKAAIYLGSAIGVAFAFAAPAVSPWARIGLPQEPVFARRDDPVLGRVVALRVVDPDARRAFPHHGAASRGPGAW